jgi:hypothetical protein
LRNIADEVRAASAASGGLEKNRKPRASLLRSREDCSATPRRASKLIASEIWIMLVAGTAIAVIAVKVAFLGRHRSGLEFIPITGLIAMLLAWLARVFCYWIQSARHPLKESC